MLRTLTTTAAAAQMPLGYRHYCHEQANTTYEVHFAGDEGDERAARIQVLGELFAALLRANTTSGQHYEGPTLL